MAEEQEFNIEAKATDGLTPRKILEAESKGCFEDLEKEKQEALRTAMREREINVESLVGFIRLAWPKYLDDKKKRERQVQRKKKERQKRPKDQGKEQEKTVSSGSTT
ncbi:unnamed protein product [Penicillium pancosmium]